MTILDLLFQRDSRTLKELEAGVTMTRFGVMKHLKVLEDAELAITRRSGREKLHFLNVAGAQGRAGRRGLTNMTNKSATTQVYRIVID
ncbi:MAG: helix-turn-helix domain-containing protein [Reyranella sp.]|nr:helix-turn-helix domain-containing protein [Reyranella sp.]